MRYWSCHGWSLTPGVLHHDNPTTEQRHSHDWWVLLFRMLNSILPCFVVDLVIVAFVTVTSSVFRHLKNTGCHKTRDRNGLSQYSRTSLHNHRQNTPKPCFMTISVFRWNSCGLSKCLNGLQGQTLKNLVAPVKGAPMIVTPVTVAPVT